MDHPEIYSEKWRCKCIKLRKRMQRGKKTEKQNKKRNKRIIVIRNTIRNKNKTRKSCRGENEKEEEENKTEKAKKLSSTRSLLIVSGVQPICRCLKRTRDI
jgi:hypothetical protein